MYSKRCKRNKRRLYYKRRGVALVHKYDTEFPSLYFKEFLEFTDLTEDQFWDIAEKWRNHNLWKKMGMIGLKSIPLNENLP